jgi:hypothetical protein
MSDFSDISKRVASKKARVMPTARFALRLQNPRFP